MHDASLALRYKTALSLLVCGTEYGERTPTADFRISAAETTTNFALEVAVVESRSMPTKLITLLRQRSMVVVSGRF